MFDEMFPGMGMMGAYGMMPGMMYGGINPMMFGGMQQYGRPGADIFSDIGVMGPQQQMFQGIEMQNMMEQNQLAREQQMMALRNMTMNMGANAAQVGSGFAGPMFMNMGGLQPSWTGQLTQGLNSAIGAIANGGQSGQPSFQVAPGGQMLPSDAQAAMDPQNQIDPVKIINDSLQATGDPAKGYSLAANTMSQIADATNNDQLRMQAARLRARAFQLQQSEAASSAGTNKSNAQAAEAQARAGSISAEMYMPKPLGIVHNNQGETGLAYSQIDPKTGKPVVNTMGWGVPIQYVSPNTPTGMNTNLQNYQSAAVSGLDSLQRISQLQSLIKTKGGAGQGWAADGITFANDLLGTFRQLAPNSTLGKDAEDALTKYNGTFSQWANKTAVSESLWSDLTMGLAGVYAHGQRISNVDIKRAADTLGESLSNPDTINQVLNSVKGRMVEHLDNMGEMYGMGGTPQYRAEIQSINALIHRKAAIIGTGTNSSTPQMGDSPGTTFTPQSEPSAGWGKATVISP